MKCEVVYVKSIFKMVKQYENIRYLPSLFLFLSSLPVSFPHISSPFLSSSFTSSFLFPFVSCFCVFALHVCYLQFLDFTLTLNAQSIELIYTPLIIVFMKKSKFFIYSVFKNSFLHHSLQQRNSFLMSLSINESKIFGLNFLIIFSTKHVF